MAHKPLLKPLNSQLDFTYDLKKSLLNHRKTLEDNANTQLQKTYGFGTEPLNSVEKLQMYGQEPALEGNTDFPTSLSMYNMGIKNVRN